MGKRVVSVAIVLYLCIFSLSSHAKMYKCVDENGEVTYSQTACQGNQTTDKVLGSTQKKTNQEDCKYAGQFAKRVMASMRAGNEADVVFDQYGGINALSKSSIAIINYVYTYKQTPDVSANRIASLTVAKCNARSFGTVVCEDFPDDFQRSIGPYGCDEDKALEQGLPPTPAAMPEPELPTSEPQAVKKPKKSSTTNSSSKKNKAKEITDCKARYDQRIADIDAQLREGYDAVQGESLNTQRRKLVDARYSDCR